MLRSLVRCAALLLPLLLSPGAGAEDDGAPASSSAPPPATPGPDAAPQEAPEPEPDLWEGYVHPDPENPERYQYVGTHTSLKACRRWAHAVLNVSGALEDGYYECGKNCAWELQPDESGVVKRCEEIAR